MNIDVTSTAQLLICLIALVWIVRLFLSHGAKHAGSTDTKVHTLYISGIGTLIILELVVYICLQSSVDKRTIMDTVAFGATLSSLIMSVLAIIFTITSGKDNDRTVGSVESAVQKLESTTQELTQFALIAKKIDKKTDSLMRRIDDLHNFEQSNWNNFNLRNLSELNGINTAKSKASYPKEKMADVYREYINRSSFFGVLAILACVYAYNEKNGSTISNRFNIKKAFSFLEFESALSLIDYMYGYLSATSSLGFITVEIEENEEIEVTYVAEDIETFLMNRIKLQVEYEDEDEEEDSELLAIETFNSLRKFFNLKGMSKEEILRL